MDMPDRVTKIDLLVVGAGPAGVALAIRMVELGYDVLLVSAQLSKLGHRHETLSPTAQEQLRTVGLAAALEDADCVLTPMEVRWDTDTAVLRGPVNIIDRQKFHCGLLRMAHLARLWIFRGKVEALQQNKPDWQVKLSADGSTRALVARFVVDATGRRARLQPGKTERGHSLIAIHTVWSGRELPDCVRAFSSDEGWLWGAPVGVTEYLTTLFVDPHGAGGRRRHVLSNLSDRIIATGILGPQYVIDKFTLYGACDATPHLRNPFGEDGLIRVGEALLAIDPISSCGIQVAIQSGIDAAHAIHTLSLRPWSRASVQSFLSSRANRRQARHAAWAAGYYRSAALWFQSEFWRVRADIETPDNDALPVPSALPQPSDYVGLASSTHVGQLPCLVGDLVEERIVVDHPSLDGAVAFVDGFELMVLLADIPQPREALSIVAGWSTLIGHAAALKIFSWCWRSGLICPAANGVAVSGRR
ncbi:lycopene cyclase family protein [Rhizobium sp. ICMP 5592]|uniref:flavin-dependent monooxygenase QhpG n=1 Tax=Rhizobium sp. ICMP 5592 TaxID=2292445 RepID=UPI0012970C59|nr:hypothetical protein [Rhizobium sp. ICMP 5592]